MKCSLCMTGINIFNSKKIRKGNICLDCQRTLPSVLYLKGYDADDLIDIRDYMNSNIIDDFEETASLGTLHIDDTHGYICFSNKMIEGKPLNKSAIFDIKTVDEMNIYVGDYRRKGISYVCDINCMVSIADTHIRFTKIVKSNVPCEAKKVNGSLVEWTPPAEIELFKNMVNQMLQNQITGLLPLIRSYNDCRSIAEKLAQYSLLLDDTFTKEELKRNRNILFKAFHPDNGGSNDAIDKIKASYEILEPLAVDSKKAVSKEEKVEETEEETAQGVIEEKAE